MKQAKIFVAGIGPGSADDVTPAVLEAVRQSDVIIGYKYYFQFVEPYVSPETRPPLRSPSFCLTKTVTFSNLKKSA